MGFLVAPNESKTFNPTNRAMRTAIEEIIDNINPVDIDRPGKHATKGSAFRIDITPASDRQMLVQMQYNHETYATALFSLDLVPNIVENFEEFQTALKTVLATCQSTGKNTIITWVADAT